jgi:hypothetical protein
MTKDGGPADGAGDLSVSQPMPWGMRVFLAAFGAAAIIFPAYDIGWAIWPPNLLTVFVLAMILVSSAIGLAFLIAAVAGEEQIWSFPPSEVVIDRKSLVRATVTRLRAGDVASLGVRHTTDSEGPDKWDVVVKTVSGLSFQTQDFLSPVGAEALAARLRAHLGLPDPDGAAGRPA